MYQYILVATRPCLTGLIKTYSSPLKWKLNWRDNVPFMSQICAGEWSEQDFQVVIETQQGQCTAPERDDPKKEIRKFTSGKVCVI